MTVERHTPLLEHAPCLGPFGNHPGPSRIMYWDVESTWGDMERRRVLSVAQAARCDGGRGERGSGMQVSDGWYTGMVAVVESSSSTYLGLSLSSPYHGTWLLLAHDQRAEQPVTALHTMVRMPHVGPSRLGFEAVCESLPRESGTLCDHRDLWCVAEGTGWGERVSNQASGQTVECTNKRVSKHRRVSDRVWDNTRRMSLRVAACPYPVHPRRPLLVHPVPVERDGIVDEGVDHMDNNSVSLVDDNWRSGNLPVHGWAGAVEAVCVKEIATGRDTLLLAAVSRVGGAVPGGRVWLSKGVASG